MNELESDKRSVQNCPTDRRKAMGGVRRYMQSTAWLFLAFVCVGLALSLYGVMTGGNWDAGLVSLLGAPPTAFVYFVCRHRLAILKRHDEKAA